MTQIATTAPHAIRFPGAPRFKLPRLRIGDAINGFASAVNKAVCLAYVDPFTARRPQTEIFVDVDLEGRDPHW